MISERQFIQQLQDRFPARPPVQVGIGDDGAVLDGNGHRQQVVVTDMLLDQVHFDLQTAAPGCVGRKAIAVNLSDLAAMACWPTAAFVSLAIPRTMESSEKFLTELYDGIAELAGRYDFTIAGGDTNSWNGPFAVSVCLTGRPIGRQAILRSGAQVGDAMFVTGPLGGSLASGRHLTFEPELETARWLAENVDVHAMMDISDGLSIDLHRMMEASCTGAKLSAENIPIHRDIANSVAEPDRLRRAFSDGEDFVLLFTVACDQLQKLAAAPMTFKRIGAVVKQSSGIVLESSDGSCSAVPETGWQHC